MGPRKRRYALWQSVILASIFVLCGAILAALLDFQEVCYFYTHSLAKYKLDGFLLALPLLCLVGACFVLWRANQHLKREQALRQKSEKRLKDIAHSMADWIWETDQDNRYVFSSTAARHILGYDPQEILGKTPFDLMPPEEAKRVEPIFQEIIAAKAPIKNLENWALNKGGERVCLLTCGVPLLDAGGGLLGYRGVDRDITAHKRAEADLHRMFYYDALTGLPNRIMFQEHLKKALARAQREGRSVAVMFMDLDQFKYINDTMGHAAGDLLLKEAAQRLTDEIRGADVVARFGGDEFAILQADLSHADGASALASRILETVSQPYFLEGQEIRLTASIGITLHAPRPREASPDLLAQADRALYGAKYRGRNRFVYHDKQMEREVRSHATLSNDLHRALEHQEFQVHYQPQVSVPGGRIIGLEALVRWQHPQRGLLRPKEFVKTAEDTGLIIPIGQWVLHQACDQLKAWEDQGLVADIHMAVNLSPVQVSAPEFGSMVRGVLGQAGLSPDCLELELTENILMDSTPEVMEALYSLQAEGVKLSIDDFGTGYSSLQYLKRLPVYKLKIAQEFVFGLPGDPNDAAIVSAIVELGRRLDLAVIAEGVETPEQLAFLQAQGCNEIQGYYFSRPKPPQELTPLLQAGRIQPE